MVTATWRLEEPDLAAVNDLLGPDALPGYTVGVTRGYDNRLQWQIDVDERRVVSNLMRRAKLDAEDLRSLWSVTNVAELVQALRALEAPTPAQTALLLDVEERPLGRPARRAGGGDAREAPAAVPLLRRVPPAAG